MLQRFSETELGSAATVTVLVAVLTWYNSSLSGLQGATNALIVAAVTLCAFAVGLLGIKRWNPSWYSPQ